MEFFSLQLQLNLIILKQHGFWVSQLEIEKQPLPVTEQEGRSGGVHDCEKVMQTKFALFSPEISPTFRIAWIRYFGEMAEIFCRIKRNFRNISLSRTKPLTKVLGDENSPAEISLLEANLGRISHIQGAAKQGKESNKRKVACTRGKNVQIPISFYLPF